MCKLIICWNNNKFYIITRYLMQSSNNSFIYCVRRSTDYLIIWCPLIGIIDHLGIHMLYPRQRGGIDNQLITPFIILRRSDIPLLWLKWKIYHFWKFVYSHQLWLDHIGKQITCTHQVNSSPSSQFPYNKKNNFHLWRMLSMLFHSALLLA